MFSRHGINLNWREPDGLAEIFKLDQEICVQVQFLDCFDSYVIRSLAAARTNRCPSWASR